MGRVSLLLALLLLSTTATGHAAGAETGTIRGTVHAADSRVPLAGATVTVLGTGQVVTTDDKGGFVIENVTAELQQLDVSYRGYEHAVITIQVVAGGEATAPAVLARDTFVGEEVVVTGSRFPEKRLEAPVTVERVDEEDVATTGGSSYLAALSQVKGIDFANTGVNEKRISARGFNSQFNSRMLTMVDGRLAQLPGNGLPQGNLLPTSSLDVKAVEVVVGPASALYGPNAHTGVVNVITKTPWDQSGASIALRGGTSQLFDVSGRVAGTFADRFGWKLNGQFLTAQDFAPDRGARAHYYGATTSPLVFEGDLVDDYDTRATKAEGFVFYRDGDFNLKAGYGFSLNDGFTLTNAGRNHILGWQVHYQTVQLSHPNWFAQVTRTAGDAGRSYQLERLGTLAQGMGGAPDDPGALDDLRDQIKFIDKSQLYDGEVQYRNQLGDLRLTTGAQLRVYMPVSEGTYLADAGGKELRATELGGYLQLDYPLVPERLRLVGAGRLDTHSNYSPQLSPKAAAVVTLAPTHHVRAGYNRAFKSPTMLENYLLIGGNLLGNKDGFVIQDAAGAVIATIDPLEPEVVDAVELGYKGAVEDWLFIDAVAYYSWYQSFISPLSRRSDPAMGTFAYHPDGTIVGAGTPTEGSLFTYANFGKAQAAGGDLGVDVAVLPRLLLQGSVSVLRLVDFQSDDATQKDLILNVPELKLRGGIAAHDLGLAGSFVKLSARWQAAYAFESGRWSSAALIDGGEVPARLTLDAVLGWHARTGLTVSVNVFNVLDDRGIDVLGAPPAGRLAYVQVAYEFEALDY